MLLLRLLAILAAFAIGASVLGWIFTRDRRYLTFAVRVGKGSLIIALGIMALLGAERLIVL
jgi:hypothetical protein